MSLIEVVVFIVVLGIGIAGTVILYTQVTKASVDPMVRKQALALAASLLEEIELRAFTYCDPDDPAVTTANSTSDCGAGLTEIIGPNEPSANAETRYATPLFDNVNDYHGFSMSGSNIKGADGSTVAGLAGYTVGPVTVVNAGADFAVTADEVLLITVPVSHAGTGITVSLQGYRFRYAPRSP